MNNRIKNIINYWNRELLCSFESSTSHADPDLSYLDNIIENNILTGILKEFKKYHIKQGKCIDVGAGYGRFTPTLKNFFEDIVLLEAAERIYKRLESLWKFDNSVKCKYGTFEAYENGKKYDLIFASGLLYLYDEEMVQQFLKKGRNMLAKDGLLIIRDFVAEPQKVIKSGYVEGSFCYYRAPYFWKGVAPPFKFEVLQIVRAKPKLSFLRNRKMLNLLRNFQASKLLRNHNIAKAAMIFGSRQLAGKGIQTVYIVMRAI